MMVVITLPISTMNITGFFTWLRGSSFGNESLIACLTISGSKMFVSLRAIDYFPWALSRARLSFRTLTPGSPKKPSERPSVLSEMSFFT